MQQPKTINKSYKTRNIPIGKERRLNAVKNVLNHQPHFPKAVTYADIDQCVYNWVDKEIDLTYMGTKLPTYKLFSIQRASEYSQMWDDIDEKGNINANFKTITRESNPQHGDNQGNNYNIPGDREYTIFQTTVAEEKGDEVTQIYTMKQPMSVNLVYKVSIITTSYEMLNEMNVKIQKQFKGLERYIFPNGFAMPMILDSVSDESDYTVDDKKYYGQSYQIKVMAFIITEDDYNVKKVPSRKRMQFVIGENLKKKEKAFKKFDIGTFDDRIGVEIVQNSCKSEPKLEIQHEEVSFEELYNPISGHSEITIEDIIGQNTCWTGTEDEISVNRKVIITIPISLCDNISEFELDSNLELETLSLKNIKKFHFYVNGDEIDIENSDVEFKMGDNLKINATLKDVRKTGEISLICYDPDSILEETEEIMVK